MAQSWLDNPYFRRPLRTSNGPFRSDRTIPSPTNGTRKLLSRPMGRCLYLTERNASHCPPHRLSLEIWTGSGQVWKFVRMAYPLSIPMQRRIWKPLSYLSNSNRRSANDPTDHNHSNPSPVTQHCTPQPPGRWWGMMPLSPVRPSTRKLHIFVPQRALCTPTNCSVSSNSFHGQITQKAVHQKWYRKQKM